MPADDFHQLFDALLRHVRGLIRGGALSERGLARLMGYSQPHVHNVLSGVRHMNARFADDLLGGLGLSLKDLTPTTIRPAPLSHIPVPLVLEKSAQIANIPAKKA